MRTEATSSVPETLPARPRVSRPDDLQVDDVQWALFAAGFSRTGASRSLCRLMARKGEAMRAAGISPPEPVGPRHETEDFDCGVEELNALLKGSAGHPDAASADTRATQTFVIASGHRVVGYYSSRPGSIFRAGGAEGERIRLTIIPRFAIDRRWTNSEITADLLWHLVRNAYAAAPTTGSRALFGYAINGAVKRLYMRLGARPVPKLVHPLATMISFANVTDALRNPI